MVGRKRRYVRTIHFRSKKAYEKWLAYNFIHNKSKMLKKPSKKVIIKGKVHKVKHTRRRR